MTQVNVTPELLGNVVGYIEKSSAIMQGVEKQAAAVDAQARSTLETLKKQGLASENADDEVLLSQLRDPVKALIALDKTARQVTAPQMGHPAEVKEASVSEPGERESDAQFAEAFLGDS